MNGTESHVYILKHSSLPFIKIGKADHVLQRVASIGKDHFNISESFSLKLTSIKEAYQLERVLHFIFKGYRVSPKEGKDKIGNISGVTEWFKIECLEKLTEFLRVIQDEIKFVKTEYFCNPIVISNPLVSDEVRKQRKDDRLNKVKEDRKRHNRFYSNCLDEGILLLKEHCDLVNTSVDNGFYTLTYKKKQHSKYELSKLKMDLFHLLSTSYRYIFSTGSMRITDVYIESEIKLNINLRLGSMTNEEFQEFNEFFFIKIRDVILNSGMLIENDPMSKPV